MPVNKGQTVAQAWEAYVGTSPEDVIWDEYSELARLEEGKSFKSFTGGRSINGSIEYAENPSVEAITPTQTLSVNFVDTFDEFEYSWKQYAGTVPMSSFESAVNRGENAKFDLQASKLENLRQSMRSRINTDLFGAVSGNNMNGYQTLIADTPTSATVGGIDRGTYTFWRNQTTSGANTGTAFNQLRAAMRTIRGACAKGQGVKFPTRYVTTLTVANGYESLLIANERINDEKTNAKANAAFKGDVYKFGAADVHWDDDCGTDRMYAVNNENVKLAYQSGYWFKGYPAVEPANQLIEVFKVETQCQLITNNPRHLGVITSIS
jgi:hypothetical protein